MPIWETFYLRVLGKVWVLSDSLNGVSLSVIQYITSYKSINPQTSLEFQMGPLSNAVC